MHNKYRYKKPIVLSRSMYNLVDLMKANEIIKLLERNNKNITLKVIETPKTLIIEEV